MKLGRSHHCEQEFDNSCVAACVGMVRRYRGEPHDERALMASGGYENLSMRLAARLLAGKYFTMGADEMLDCLDRVGLGDDACLIVKVISCIYVKECGEQPGGRASKFGQLEPPGDHGMATHAIVVVGGEGETVYYLDPWYPSEGQPLTMSRETLLKVCGGAVVEVNLSSAV